MAVLANDQKRESLGLLVSLEPETLGRGKYKKSKRLLRRWLWRHLNSTYKQNFVDAQIANSDAS